jgi:hypothetical protein
VLGPLGADGHLEVHGVIGDYLAEARR